MAEREIKRWVTWHGRRIPIYEGESKADVAARIKGEAKEGLKKGKEFQKKQRDQHDQDVKAKKEALDKARKKSNEKGRKWADNPTERRKQAYQKAVDDAQKASKDFSDAYDNKVKAKFHKKGESDHDKAVEFFAKKEGISKEKAANMVKNMNPETVKRLMAKGDTKKSEYKSEISKFNVEDYKKKVASDSDFYAKVAGIKSKKMVDKEKAKAAAKKGSKVEDVGHGLRRFQTADGRTLYKDASGHWVKKADAEAKLKGSDSGKKEPKDVFEAAKMMHEGDGTVTTKDKKIINAYKSNGSYGVVDNADGSSTIMSKSSDAWKKHAGTSSSNKKSAPAKTEEIKGSKTYSQADFDKEFGKDMAKDSGLERPGTKITSIHVPDDDENPYLGVEYSDGKTYVYGASFDRPVDKDTMKKMVSAPARSEDEAVKEKQIANAEKQKAERNGKKYNNLIDVRNTDRGRELIDQIEEAEEEMRGRGLKDGDDDPWVRAKESAVSDLKKEFGYSWDKKEKKPMKKMTDDELRTELDRLHKAMFKKGVSDDDFEKMAEERKKYSNELSHRFHKKRVAEEAAKTTKSSMSFSSSDTASNEKALKEFFKNNAKGYISFSSQNKTTKEWTDTVISRDPYHGNKVSIVCSRYFKNRDGSRSSASAGYPQAIGFNAVAQQLKVYGDQNWDAFTYNDDKKKKGKK